MKRLSTSVLLPFLLAVLVISCTNNSSEETTEFTGNEVRMEMVPATVQGNTTSGTIVIREKTDGSVQLDITMNGVIANAVHPVHLHFGSLEVDGDVATYLGELREENGIGISSTVLGRLSDNSTLSYSDFLQFDGSIKVHFEESGPLEDEILGAVNVGLNADQNEAYLNGTKSITICNSDFSN